MSWCDGWPLEARCLAGLFAPLLFVVMLFALSAMLVWEQFGGEV